LDSSTQGLKATAIDGNFKVVSAFAINYQKDLPHYELKNGVHASAGNVVTQPTLMYLEALDLLLAQMKAKGFPFERVAAVSGSGQQHGSAYWGTGSRALLQRLAPGKPLKVQLAGAFRLANSPIWMDSSTGAQCAALEKALGGAQRVASLSGSRAYERFTGNQIAKVAGGDAAAYKDTERVSLISSLMCSVLLGDYAPIDFSDGCGMNLLNLQSRAWDPALLAATAPGLGAKLGAPAPSHAAVGTVGAYFSGTYGLPKTARVIAWSGDNPCSVAGLGLSAPGDVAVSLGTSDTMFGILPAPTPGLEGHIFVNPMDPASYMAMLCYKNGSLTRERVRDAVAGGSWDAFGKLLAEGAPGNGGAVGFYIDAPEITPHIPAAGTRRFDKGGKRVAAFAPAVEARAVVEGQFLSMRAHGAALGMNAPKRLIATGGGSANKAILQVLADVFGAPVFVAAQTDSASLGAAVRALHGARVAEAGGKFSPVEAMRPAASSTLAFAAAPAPAATAAYTALLPHYLKAEKEVCAEK
jgi:xylulokinase